MALQKKKIILIFLIKINIKILSKILANQIQKQIKIIYYDRIGFISGIQD